VTVTVSVRLNHAAIQALLLERVALIGVKVRNVARRRAPKLTGRLTTSLSSHAHGGGQVVYADIGTPLAYGLYQHEGTGVYAGGRPIRPKRARYMRFRPGRPVGPVQGGGRFRRGGSRGSGWVYAREVQGVPPNPFLTTALAAVVGVHPGTRIRQFRRSGRRG